MSRILILFILLIQFIPNSFSELEKPFVIDLIGKYENHYDQLSKFSSLTSETFKTQEDIVASFEKIVNETEPGEQRQLAALLYSDLMYFFSENKMVNNPKGEDEAMEVYRKRLREQRNGDMEKTLSVLDQAFTPELINPDSFLTYTYHLYSVRAWYIYENLDSKYDLVNMKEHLDAIINGKLFQENPQFDIPKELKFKFYNVEKRRKSVINFISIYITKLAMRENYLEGKSIEFIEKSNDARYKREIFFLYPAQQYPELKKVLDNL